MPKEEFECEGEKKQRKSHLQNKWWWGAPNQAGG